MAASDSDDALLPGSSDSDEFGDFLDRRTSSSSEDERGGGRRAAKKRRLTSTDSLGLELVTGAALHPAAPGLSGAPAAAAYIDASEEAEASLLQLEVEGLLREARPDTAAEGPLLALLQRLAATLRALPTAEVAAGGLLRGFLSDLGFRPVVSLRGAWWGAGVGRDVGTEAHGMR